MPDRRARRCPRTGPGNPTQAVEARPSRSYPPRVLRLVRALFARVPTRDGAAIELTVSRGNKISPARPGTKQARPVGKTSVAIRATTVASGSFNSPSPQNGWSPVSVERLAHRATASGLPSWLHQGETLTRSQLCSRGSSTGCEIPVLRSIKKVLPISARFALPTAIASRSDGFGTKKVDAGSAASFL